MPSQKREKRRNRNCYKKQVKTVCQLKLFLREMSHILLLIRTPIHLIYKMVLQVLHEIIQAEETPNYDHPDNKPTENNH